MKMKKLTVRLTPTGVIDAGYTGSISVVLVSKYDLRIFAGNRIAQQVIVPLPDVHLVEGDVTGVKSERGLGGFKTFKHKD